MTNYPTRHASEVERLERERDRQYNEPSYIVDWKELNHACLMMFHKKTDGINYKGEFDIVDGKFSYNGNLPISDAARAVFDYLAANCDTWWMERATGTPRRKGKRYDVVDFICIFFAIWLGFGLAHLFGALA